MMARNVDLAVLALGNAIEVNAHANVLDGRSFVVTKLPFFLHAYYVGFLLVTRMSGSKENLIRFLENCYVVPSLKGP